ncbi:uncharacterized protein LOC116348057 [Contarinia nasturtii]|uniref:uncharacterized protein LOC116348057 n=1 Tax=Contarinia nasturtii TaxID=265458 RepID=UPI0012D470F5|nr:uncharacterized protein LOC116348057 [Contarinia nasturtii]
MNDWVDPAIVIGRQIEPLYEEFLSKFNEVDVVISTNDDIPITSGRTAKLTRFVHNSRNPVAFEFNYQDTDVGVAWETADKIFLKSKCPRCDQRILINDLEHLADHFQPYTESTHLREFMLANFKVDESLVKFAKRFKRCCTEFNRILHDQLAIFMNDHGWYLVKISGFFPSDRGCMYKFDEDYEFHSIDGHFGASKNVRLYFNHCELCDTYMLYGTYKKHIKRYHKTFLHPVKQKWIEDWLTCAKI